MAPLHHAAQRRPAAEEIILLRSGALGRGYRTAAEHSDPLPLIP